MTDREAMQMALDALETVTAKMLDCRDELAEYGGRPKSTGHKQRLWDSSHDVYVDNAIPAAEALRTALAQGEQEPVACIVKGCRNRKGEGRFVGKLCSPCHTFITTGEGKYSQVYRNTQRGWQWLTDEDIEAAFMANTCCDDLVVFEHIARAIEAKLKEKDT